MKKTYSLLLVFLLALSPIIASASEVEPSPSTEQTIAEIPAASPEAGAQIEASKTDDGEISDPVQEQITLSEQNSTDITTDGNITTDILPDAIINDSDKTVDKSDMSEPIEEIDITKTEPAAHTHAFIYTSNNDGTHTITCSEPVETEETTEACNYEMVEECTFDEEGICIYCKYVKPEEEKEFAPSISFSITNQTCTIDEVNPVISVSLSQEDFDIAYAQVCFANYGKNKFINVGLAQGKYYDSNNDVFVYTSNNNWYASPNIDGEYVAGEYSLRSIYVRSTTGESIHYSIESDSLPEAYQNIAITLNENTPEINNEINEPKDSIVNEPVVDNSVIEGPVTEEPISEEPVTEEPVTEEPVTEEPVTGEPVTGEAYNENPNIDQPSTPNNSSSTEENNTVEKSKNESNNKNEENDSETNNMLSNFFKFLRKFFGWG